jgi:hypothetical protein
MKTLLETELLMELAQRGFSTRSISQSSLNVDREGTSFVLVRAGSQTDAVAVLLENGECEGVVRLEAAADFVADLADRLDALGFLTSQAVRMARELTPPEAFELECLTTIYDEIGTRGALKDAYDSVTAATLDGERHGWMKWQVRFERALIGRVSQALGTRVAGPLPERGQPMMAHELDDRAVVMGPGKRGSIR